MHPKWEYLVEGLPVNQGQSIGIVRTNMSTPVNHIQNHLNGRGEDGWEFVQFASAVEQAGCNLYAPGLIFIFKRLKM